MDPNAWLWIAMIILTILLLTSIIILSRLYQCRHANEPCLRAVKNILPETEPVPTEFSMMVHEDSIQDTFTRCERIHGVGNCKLSF